jgi:hypothetical protein
MMFSAQRRLRLSTRAATSWWNTRVAFAASHRQGLVDVCLQQLAPRTQAILALHQMRLVGEDVGRIARLFCLRSSRIIKRAPLRSSMS